MSIPSDLVAFVRAWVEDAADGLSYVDRHGIPASVAAFERIQGSSVTMRYSPGSSPESYEVLCSLAPVRVDSVSGLYRGAVETRARGMCWTTSLGAAVAFADERGGAVYTAAFEPDDFLAVITCVDDRPGRQGRGEEWVMRPPSVVDRLELPPLVHVSRGELDATPGLVQMA